MASRLSWFLLVWLLIEITSFVWVAEMVGLATMLLLLVLSSVAGVAIMRYNGIVLLQKLSTKMQSRQPILASDLDDAPMLLLAGLLLTIPGFFSDLLALLSLIPSLRHFALRQLFPQRKTKQRSVDPGLQGGRTFEGDYHRDDN